MSEPNYKIVKEEKHPGSKESFDIEVGVEVLKTKRSPAVRELSKDLELPGFRKGQVPEKILVGKIGEMGVLEESARIILNEIIPQLVSERKLLVVAHPEISVTKLAPENPLQAKITFTVLPEINLPDYKKIAAKINGEKKEAVVTEKEFETAINNVRRHFKSKPTEPTKDEQTKNQTDSDADLPELTDDLVKQTGDFKNVADFKEKTRAEMLQDAKRKETEKIRLKIVDELESKTKLDLPEVLVEHELNRMFGEFKGNLERFQMKVEDYLKQAKKTETDLRKEWHGEAVKRAKTQLIIGKIASVEKLYPKKAEIDHEVEHLFEHRRDLNRENAEAYFEMVLTNEKVFEFLEAQK